MFTNIRYVLLTAIRDRLFLGLFLGVLFAAYVSSAMGSTAMLEPGQMTVAFTAASSRIILMVGIIVFIAFHIRGAFDSREIDLLLSRPISRARLVLSYWLGFAVVATLLTLPAIAAVAWFGFRQDVISAYGLLVWGISLVLEAWLVVSLALFAAVSLRSGVVTVLASLGFYAISRMMGFFVATTKTGMLFETQVINVAARWTMKAISLIVPRADFFGKSGWLVYGVEASQMIWLFAIQAAIFIPLLVAATVIDFSRKQF
jgi:ABC-type transport system involved in multi-copper enzyme maturation permease subunit